MTFFSQLILVAFSSFLIAVVGSALNWKPWVVVLTGAAMGGLIGLVSANAATPIPLLRETAVRISIGSGSIVEGKSGKQYILTNYHVCLGDTWKGGITVFFPDGKTITGRIVKRAPAVDLCAASVAKQNAALKIGRRPAPNEEVYTRGFPEGILSESHGYLGPSFNWEYHFPIDYIGECPPEYRTERGFDGRVVGCRVIFSSQLTSLYGRPGSSGSPVVNKDGDLVGVVSSFNPESAYELGAVKYEQVKEFLESL